MNGQLLYSFLFSVKLTELKWSESFWTIQVQCVVNLFLCSSFRQTGLRSNFKLRNKPWPLYSVIVWGLWVLLSNLRSFKTNQSLHIIWERFTQMNDSAYQTVGILKLSTEELFSIMVQLFWWFLLLQLWSEIPFDPQNATQQESVNCKHATSGKPPAKQLSARNTTPLDPQTHVLSTSEVKHTQSGKC